MKSRITKTVALAALMAGAAGVANATEGWYGRGDVGWSFDGEIDVSDDYAGYDFGKSNLEHDWSEHLGLGYAFANSFRLEGEIGHRFNQIDTTDTIDAGGDVHAWSAMANLFYDFNRGGSIEPYIGVGVGAARLNYNVNDHSSLNYAEGEDTVFAYQGMVGFAVGLGQQWDLDIGYRYFVADGAEGNATDTNSVGSSLVVTPYNVDADYTHQALTVGLRYQFAAPAPPPPPPPPPLPPPPPPPPVAAACPTSEFVVYFEWDRSNLNQAALETIDAAVNRARQCNVSGTVVVGHTDTSGSTTYNQGL
ncbi:MAG: outer membrane beta-barrel protein, partial [Hyphomonadaceae bacterium]|nr:outer membrane beta-barrel protein [Hyphomonadaceae bacterium]